MSKLRCRLQVESRRESEQVGQQQEAAEHFGVNEKQVSEWRKSGDKLQTMKKTAKRLEGAGRLVTC